MGYLERWVLYDDCGSITPKHQRTAAHDCVSNEMNLSYYYMRPKLTFDGLDKLD